MSWPKGQLSAAVGPVLQQVSELQADAGEPEQRAGHRGDALAELMQRNQADFAIFHIHLLELIRNKTAQLVFFCPPNVTGAQPLIPAREIPAYA